MYMYSYSDTGIVAENFGTPGGKKEYMSTTPAEFSGPTGIQDSGMDLWFGENVQTPPPPPPPKKKKKNK